MNRSLRHFESALSVALCATLLSACGSGAGTLALPVKGPTSDLTTQSLTPGTTPQSNVSFVIGITPRAAGRVGPQYVSASTQSMQIRTDTTNVTVVDLTPSSPNCRPKPAVPGSYICQAALSAPAGNHVFTVTTFDGKAAKGNVLSTNTTGVITLKSTGTTTVSIVLQGVVQWVILTLAEANPPSGAAASIALTALIEDADGNLIVGPAPYLYPVTLTTSDPVNGPLSKTTLHSPADSAGVTANYSGAAVARITYSATATSLAPDKVSAAVLAPGQTAAGSIVKYLVDLGAPPDGITAGSDGNMWFAATNPQPPQGTGDVAKITPSGAVTTYPAWAGGEGYPDLTTGGDHNVWFVEEHALGRITPNGTLTQFATAGDTSSFFYSIAAGADGNLWYTSNFGAYGNCWCQITKITPAGNIISDFFTPSGSQAYALAAGADGTMWFSEGTGEWSSGTFWGIGKITPDGGITEYAGVCGILYALTTGPDGNVWCSGGNSIVKVASNGAQTEYTAGISANAGIRGLTSGPDGNVWFTESSLDRIGKITRKGVVTEYSQGLARGDAPQAIAAGHDGYIWFTYKAGIGKIHI